MPDAAVVALALLLDFAIGEPPSALHPVVWMGHAIAPLKRFSGLTPLRALVVGALWTLAVSAGFALLAWVAVRLAERASPYAGWVVGALLLWCCYALRGLIHAGQEMRAALAAGDLARARAALGSLCSRDPAPLSSTELAGASIESVAENLCDSVIAPLFYFVLLGVPGAVFYRAANTLDAMVGYRGRFEYLGKFAARLDDLLNFVPARLTALLLLLAGSVLRLPLGRGLRVGLRDARRTESPNAGWPMAVAAGLLGVRLDKRGAYVLGAELSAPSAGVLQRALRLVGLAGTFGLILACGVGRL